MSDNLLEFSRSGRVAVIKLNTPDRLNVLSEAMLGALQDQFDQLADDRETGCIVLGANGNAFCAGHDLREMTRGRQAPDGGKKYFRDIFDRCSNMMMTIQSIPKPVIAMVHGVAVAAGCQLVATCDMAIASGNARFGVNGVNIGLFCSTPMVALTRNISRKHAFEMLTTGRLVDASRARELGLVNEVVDADMLEDRVLETADLVASKLSSAVKVGKRAFYEQAQMNLADAYGYTGDVMVENMLHRDTVEGIAAFLEKRPPDWQENA